MELISRRAQFIYDRNYNRNVDCAPSRRPMQKLRRLVTQRRKVRVFYARVYGKISFLTIPPRS